MAEPRAEHDDPLSLSFLDVLSCGLGAATFLFLLFSVMPHLGASVPSSDGKARGAVAGSNSGMLGPSARVAAWTVIVEAPDSVPEASVSFESWPSRSQRPVESNNGVRRWWRIDTRIPSNRVSISFRRDQLVAATTFRVLLVVGGAGGETNADSFDLGPATSPYTVVIDFGEKDPSKRVVRLFHERGANHD